MTTANDHSYSRGLSQLLMLLRLPEPERRSRGSCCCCWCCGRGRKVGERCGAVLLTHPERPELQGAVVEVMAAPLHHVQDIVRVVRLTSKGGGRQKGKGKKFVSSTGREPSQWRRCCAVPGRCSRDECVISVINGPRGPQQGAALSCCC